MKNLFLSALVVGIGFHAAVGFAADNLKNTQLESIKAGVSLSMGAGAKCGTISSWDLNAIVNAASDVAVSNGDQPLLIFSTSSKADANGADLVKTEVWTSPDYKRVSRIKITSFKMGKVNYGTLSNPHIGSGYVPDANCVKDFSIPLR